MPLLFSSVTSEATSTVAIANLGNANLGDGFPFAPGAAGELPGWEYVPFSPTTELGLPHVFIEGVDVHDRVQAVSWRLGQDDLFASLATSNATVRLRPNGEDVLEHVGKRIVIVSPFDPLWYGYVDTARWTRSPVEDDTSAGLVDDPVEGDAGAEVELLCVDDLARAGTAAWPLSPLGGYRPEYIATLTTLAGLGEVPVEFILPADAGDPADTYALDDAEREGGALELLTGGLEVYNMALSWSPRGLRACVRALETESTTGIVDDVLSRASRFDRSATVGDVRNDWSFDEDPDFYWSRYQHEGSITQFDRRSYEYDFTEWFGDGVLSPNRGDVFDTHWAPFLDAWALPVERMTADHVLFPDDHLTADGVDELHRAIPFDVAYEGTEAAWLITSVQHSVDVSQWRVTVAGLRVAIPPPEPIATMFDVRDSECTDTWEATPGELAVGVIVVCKRGPLGTTFGTSHDVSAVTFGNVALTLVCDPLIVSSHVCVWVLTDRDAFDARDDDIVRATGGTWVNGNGYCGRAVFLENTVELEVVDAGQDTGNVSNGNTLDVVLDPDSRDGAVFIVASTNLDNWTDLADVDRDFTDTHPTTQAFLFAHATSDDPVTVGFTNVSGANAGMALAAVLFAPVEVA